MLPQTGTQMQKICPVGEFGGAVTKHMQWTSRLRSSQTSHKLGSKGVLQMIPILIAFTDSSTDFKPIPAKQKQNGVVCSAGLLAWTASLPLVFV